MSSSYNERLVVLFTMKVVKVDRFFQNGKRTTKTIFDGYEQLPRLTLHGTDQYHLFLMSFSISPCILPLAAHNSPPNTKLSPPLKSVTFPPACCTMRVPAATS